MVHTDTQPRDTNSQKAPNSSISITDKKHVTAQSLLLRCSSRSCTVEKAQYSSARVQAVVVAVEEAVDCREIPCSTLVCADLVGVCCIGMTKLGIGHS